MNEQELIERYLEGSLSSDELEQFEQLKANDPNFRKEVAFHLGLEKAISEENRMEFKNKLKGFEKSSPLKKGSTKSWWAAAAVLLLAASSYFLWLQGTPSNEKLFAQNFEPYRNIEQPIVRGDQGQSSGSETDLKTAAFMAYESGDFKEAISLFSELFTTKNESYALFYGANAHLAEGHSVKGIALLTQYLENPGRLKDKAQWYLALAYLKEGNLSEVRERLQKIIDAKGYGHPQATKILKRLG